MQVRSITDKTISHPAKRYSRGYALKEFLGPPTPLGAETIFRGLRLGLMKGAFIDHPKEGRLTAFVLRNLVTDGRLFR